MTRSPAPTAQPPKVPAASWTDVSKWSIPWMTALVFMATLIAYLPAMKAGYIWDDSGHITRPDLRSLSGLGRIWFEMGATQQYYPLVHSAFWLEWHLWGDAPVGYHLVNILLHATSAILLALTLRRLAIPGSWLAALLFALHPVGVESVAWVMEQKNTLSCALFLASAYVYLDFDTRRRPTTYLAAAGLFLLALFAKTVTAMLPGALLVVFWWKRGRLDFRRDVLPLVPWFAFGAAAGWITARFEHTMIGAQGSDYALSWLDRVVLAGRVIWFYLGKLVWPANLSFMYPRWTIDAGEVWQWLSPLAAVALTIGLWVTRRRGALAALLVFVGVLFPALGFVNVFPFIYSYVADHFQYHASLAVFAFAGAGLSWALARWPAATAGATGLLLLVLAGLSFAQAQIYRDVFTLYEATIQRNPECWMAYNNLGCAQVDAGQFNDAVPNFEAAIKVKPNYYEAENNLGDALTRAGRAREAVPHLLRALELKPDYAEARSNLGVAYLSLDRTDEGVAEIRRALQLKPEYPLAHYNLGLALARSGKTDEAISHFAEAVRLKPDYAEAEFNWGLGLTLTNRFSEAERHFDRAIELEPDSFPARLTYGSALLKAGRAEGAIAQLQHAIELDPTSSEAHLQLAYALRQAGRMTEANTEYSEAMRLRGAR